MNSSTHLGSAARNNVLSTLPTREADEQLIARIAKGDYAALSQLQLRYANSVKSALVAKLGDRTNAEVLTQQVFGHIWKRAGSFNPALSSPRSWITGLAYYYAGSVRGIQPGYRVAA